MTIVIIPHESDPYAALGSTASRIVLSLSAHLLCLYSLLYNNVKAQNESFSFLNLLVLDQNDAFAK